MLSFGAGKVTSSSHPELVSGFSELNRTAIFIFKEKAEINSCPYLTRECLYRDGKFGDDRNGF
jgi:hypothetical protein